MRFGRAVIATLAIAACAPGAPPSSGPFRGAELDRPLPKPALVFTDSRGQPFDLVQATADRVTLLFFGYTHCPDICPVHLANIAAVLDKMPDDVQRDVMVVFVTTDPARDSLAVLDRWVTGFDSRFVGLTGDSATIADAQAQLGLIPALRTAAQERNHYGVGHATQVIAFTRDGLARVQYPFGTRQRDWAEDIPKLVAFGRPPDAGTD
ncbi:MAG: SCO family protein [Gemmatimonadales bacterium]|nr:SCO family protein [Gemmatimonadales bacterium]